MNQTDLERKLQDEIDALVSRNNDVFSAVLGVAEVNRDFSWTGAAGTAHAGVTQAIEGDTKIFIASITKMYTAVATMILEERGSLSLSDPLSKHLPADLLKGLHVYRGREYTDRLSVYNLISQTSGLPDYFEARPKGGMSIYDRLVSEGDMEWDAEKAVRIAKSSLSPKFPPEPNEQERSGNKAHYSDTNYQLLGLVIVSAAQKSLYEVFSELITDPLGLSSTYLHGYKDQKSSLDSPPATIYYKTKPLFLDKAMKSFGPDGGMVSNVEDSLKFLRYLTEDRLFAHPTTLQRMKRWNKIFYPFQYGLGLMRFKLPRILSPFSAVPELIGHSGASSAFLFYSDSDKIYIGGTLNQLDNRRRPFSLMLNVMKIVREALA